MFARILVSGLFAGFAAGLIAALLQLAFVQPILLHAELYESGQLTHFGGAKAGATAIAAGGIDLVRDGLSVLFTTLIYTGYALILVAAMALAEASRGPDRRPTRPPLGPRRVRVGAVRPRRGPAAGAAGLRRRGDGSPPGSGGSAPSAPPRPVSP